MTRILLVGASGGLATAFRSIIPAASLDLLSGAPLRTVDGDAIARMIERSSADVVLNCAAHTDVESAERNPDEDRRANSELPGVIACACANAGATLVHFSSTGCYGDWKDGAYSETDEPLPTTVHHRNKLAGEQAVHMSGCEHIIIRTGWLYGGAPGHPKNFVWKRLLEARHTKQMLSDASQKGCPTFVDDVARQTLSLIDAQARGLFNVTAHGSGSRYDYVASVVEFSGVACEVKPGPAFRRLAKVSPNEVAVNGRLKELGLDQMRAWRPSLELYVRQLLASPEWQALETAGVP